MVSRVNQPRVADYSITHLAQCDGDKGVCPDQRVGGSNDVVLGKDFFTNHCNYH